MTDQPGEDLRAARTLLTDQESLGGVGSGPKRTVLRRSGVLTFRLVAAIRHVADAVEALDRRQRAEREDVRREVRSTLRADRSETADAIAGLRSELAGATGEVRTRLDRTAQELGDVAGRVTVLTDAATGTVADLTALTERVSSLERRVAEQRSGDLRAATIAARETAATRADSDADPAGGRPAPADGALDDETYLAFEERFRGSRSEIRARQRDAVGYVRHFSPDDGPLLDLACGRGEWLDVLRSEGITAYGVDSNAEMIADAAAAGLDVTCADALEHLAGVDPGSLQGISAFHFVEHIPLGVLVRMLDDSLVALRPGGSIVLESPNPTNLMVGSASFYLDPTHLRPVHPEFLRFLAESRGFVDVQIHFVHPAVPAAELQASGPPEGYLDARLGRAVSAVETFIYGAQDYVLVGRRPEGDAD